MIEIIEEITGKWGEYLEMCPEEDRWEMLARLLASELKCSREMNEYLKKVKR